MNIIKQYLFSFVSLFLIISIPSLINSQNLQEVMNYIHSILLDKIQIQHIDVIGWDRNWEHDLIPSVSKYLFEEIKITENIAPKGNINRPGDKHQKVYICVHDTGDSQYTAKQWSQAVYDAKWNNDTYEVSYQYVVGNDGIYHNIPDDETAYHAGDGAQESSYFREYASGVFGNKKNAHVSISPDGFYSIEGKKTKIKAPTNSEGKILEGKDINDLGIYTSIKGGEYYIGNTWFSKSYNYIANHGGNTNSIGIESCVNYGSDIFLTWQRLAKLVAKLMDSNNLGIESVVQHHYFSGKNCPQTMRRAGLWKMFLEMVEIEFQMLQYQKMGFKFEFYSKNEKYVNNVGRVINRGNNLEMKVSYVIKITDKNGETIEESFYTIIPPKKILLNTNFLEEIK